MNVMWHRLVVDPHRRHLLLTLLVGVGLAVYLTGSVTTIYGFDLALLLTLVGGYPIYLEAASSLLNKKISANLAVSLAAFAALWIGQYAVAAEVILIMLVGEALEHFAIGRTRSGIAALLALRPHEARVRRGDHEAVIHAEEIQPDDLVLVRPGDRIPVDGRVLQGHSSVDQSPITGESLPADKGPGDEVFAGTINLYGALELSVERLGEDTTLEQIIHLVEEAEAAKAPTERLADRYAAWFVPIVLVIAGATFLVTGDVIRAVAVLVVACPCALVLATPTAIAAGIGSLVRRGVLVKGGNVLEQLGRLRCVVFDKTGTLTLARLRVAEVVPAPGFDAADVLRLAAAVDRHSEHPIAQVLVNRAERDGLKPADAEGFVAHPGLGAEARVEGHTVRVGSPRFLEQAHIEMPKPLAAELERLGNAGSSVVLVARDQAVIGAVGVEDTVRSSARAAIRRLEALGIGRIVMLTGDHAPAARSVANQLGISDVRSGLLPADKVAAVRSLQQEAAPVAMVGDGINDAPSLVAADVGLAVADIGTDVALASADVILVGDDLEKLADAVACGRQMLRIIWQNILGFALVFNLLAVAAASLNWISPVTAAVLHQVSSLTVVLNSMRLLIDGSRWKARLAAAGAWTVRRRRLLVGGAAAVAVAAYLLSGLHVVRIGEVAVVQHFGKIVRAAEPPGLHYRLPYPLGWHWIVRPAEVRRVEVGFRTVPGDFAEPPAYEWNVQHRGGRYKLQPEEATVWMGDTSLVEVNLVVHYRVEDPVAALLGVGPAANDGSSKWDRLIRVVAEAALREELASRTSEEALASNRSEIEAAITGRLAAAMERYRSGLVLIAARLGDVHPPLEVVPAFREVASALEDKEALINEAEAYQFEKTAQAEGEAAQRVAEAEGNRADRVDRAVGQAARFLVTAAACRLAPEVTRQRLYLMAVEELLAGRRKVILDRVPPGGRRMLLLGRSGLMNLMPGSPAEPSLDEVELEGNPTP